MKDQGFGKGRGHVVSLGFVTMAFHSFFTSAA